MSIHTLINTRDYGYVSVAPQFDPEDFGSWKERILLHLTGIEPYLITLLLKGPYIPMSIHITPSQTQKELKQPPLLKN